MGATGVAEKKTTATDFHGLVATKVAENSPPPPRSETAIGPLDVTPPRIMSDKIYPSDSIG
jgi:hypothetical protein